MIMYRNKMFQKYIYNAEITFHSNALLLCFCLLTLVFLFSSCEQNLNIEIKTNDKRLLVDGEFTDDTVVHSVRLYCAGSLITGKPQTIVSGAKIYITDNIDTFYYIENKDTLGLYQTAGKVGGKGGHSYTLSITNIDIDNDGKMDSYTANSLMPVPVKFDSLVSKRGLNGDGNMAVNNYAYYKLYYNGPDYVYKSEFLNNIQYGTITNRLGSGEFTRFENEFKVPKVLNPGSFINYWSYLSINSTVVKGDTISFICFNLTNDQYNFLKEFDNNTTSDNQFNNENIYDQLKIPSNLPTNIEPADKAAGYFFIYSVSKISKVFNE
jgi:Domain of unknown function (DUF4249)